MITIRARTRPEWDEEEEEDSANLTMVDILTDGVRSEVIFVFLSHHGHWSTSSHPRCETFKIGLVSTTRLVKLAELKPETAMHPLFKAPVRTLLLNV